MVDSNYKNFDNRTSFNGATLQPNEVLVPVVLTENMKLTLKPLGLNTENAETWRFPNTSQKVPVVFIPCEKDKKDTYMKEFDKDVSMYLKRFNKNEHEVSLDAILEAMSDEDGLGVDPTGTTRLDNGIKYEMLLEKLLEKLEEFDVNFAVIIGMKEQGFKKKDIIETLDLGVQKTRAYDIIKEAEELAYKIIKSGDLE